MSDKSPRVSFGIPVHNGEKSLERCIDSVLAQDFKDFEIVVCDNASTDRTRAIVEGYANRDDRVRVFRNDRNIGLVRNFNRVFELAQGEYFRWLGSDDWLEPDYTTACVRALDADPGAIVATTYFTLNQNGECVDYVEYAGEFLESERPERRFARALWFFHAGAALFEPVYSMMRRTAIAKTGGMRMATNNDWMFVAEVALLGRFTHVPRKLFHRSWPEGIEGSRARFEWFSPGGKRELSSSLVGILRVLFEVIGSAPLSAGQRASCHRAALRFGAAEGVLRARAAFDDFRRHRLGLTRHRLRTLLGSKG